MKEKKSFVLKDSDCGLFKNPMLQLNFPDAKPLKTDVELKKREDVWMRCF